MSSTLARQTRPVSKCTTDLEASRIGLWDGATAIKPRTSRRGIVILNLFRQEVPQREQDCPWWSQQRWGSREIAPSRRREEEEGRGTQQQTSHIRPQERYQDQSFLRKREDWLSQEGWGFHFCEGQGSSWWKVKYSVWLIVSTLIDFKSKHTASLNLELIL